MLAVAATLAVLLHSREPVCRGKPLSHWVNQLGTDNSEQAHTALGQIGTNAVPFLFQMARHENGVGRRFYRAAWPKLPKLLRNGLPAPNPLDYSLVKARILAALVWIGSDAVPTLVSALDDQDEAIRSIAFEGLVQLGPGARAALPRFTRFLDDPNPGIRFETVDAIRFIGRNRVQAIAPLIRALQDKAIGQPGTTVQIRDGAAMVLGSFCYNDHSDEVQRALESAVPELRSMLNDTNSYTRRQAAIALWRITRDTSLVSDTVAELERVQDPTTCRNLLEVLGAIGPAAKPAVPALLRLMRSSMAKNPWVISNAVRTTLSRIDPETAPVRD